MKILKIILTTLLMGFLIFSIGMFLFIKYSFDQTFHRTAIPEYSAYLLYSDVEDRYSRELLRFPSGRNTLQGYLYGADNQGGLVVISHALGGGAEGYMAETVYFVDHGYQVFAFDNTGCRRSEGKNCVGLPQSALDLDAALTYLEEQSRFDGLPVFLYGHSWGGYAVTAVLQFDHEVAAAVSVAGFNDPMDMLLEWNTASLGPLAYVEHPYILLYHLALFGRNATLSALDGINSTRTPVLLIHGDADDVVDPQGAGTVSLRERIFNPNAACLIRSEPRQNGHANLFLSLDAQDYSREVHDAHQQLSQECGGQIPEEVDRAFYEGVDSARMSGLDLDRMGTVLAFFQQAAG